MAIDFRFHFTPELLFRFSFFRDAYASDVFYTRRLYCCRFALLLRLLYFRIVFSYSLIIHAASICFLHTDAFICHIDTPWLLPPLFSFSLFAAFRR